MPWAFGTFSPDARYVTYPSNESGRFGVYVQEFPDAGVIAHAHFRPTPDGQRFLGLAPLRQEAVAPTTVVLNWTSGIR